MGHSVEALLDDDADAWVRAQWQALDDAGLPGQARHPGASNRPHVTFSWAQEMPDAVEAALATGLATGLVGASAAYGGRVDVPAPLGGHGGQIDVPAPLGGLVVFPRRAECVLARLVVASAELLALHAAVLDAVRPAPGLSATSLPGAWTPHVTLSRRLPLADLPAAIAAVGAAGGGRQARLVGLRRWDGVAKREWALV